MNTINKFGNGFAEIEVETEMIVDQLVTTYRVFNNVTGLLELTTTDMDKAVQKYGDMHFYYSAIERQTMPMSVCDGL